MSVIISDYIPADGAFCKPISNSKITAYLARAP